MDRNLCAAVFAPNHGRRVAVDIVAGAQRGPSAHGVRPSAAGKALR